MSEGDERRGSSERRRRRAYRFTERRSGFDRREPSPVLGRLRDKPWLLVSVLFAANALSLVDGALTSWELALGVAREGNPILSAALAHDPAVALAIKVGALGIASLGIWQLRRYRTVVALAPVTLVLFAAVVVYHVAGLSTSGIL